MDIVNYIIVLIACPLRNIIIILIIGFVEIPEEIMSERNKDLNKT
jgi:hypothetical protein